MTAFDCVRFNEYGDSLDRPYVVRATRPFDVDGTLRVEAGSTWEIYGPSYTGNDVQLEGNGFELDLNWDDLKMFELLEEGGYDE